MHVHRTVASEREIAYGHRTAHGARKRDADVQIRMSDAIRDSDATDSDVRCNISTKATITQYHISLAATTPIWYKKKHELFVSMQNLGPDSLMYITPTTDVESGRVCVSLSLIKHKFAKDTE